MYEPCPVGVDHVYIMKLLAYIAANLMRSAISLIFTPVNWQEDEKKNNINGMELNYLCNCVKVPIICRHVLSRDLVHFPLLLDLL